MRVRSIVLFCLAIFLVSASAYADEFFVEVKGSYFRPTDQYFKDVYGNGVSYGGEIGFQASKWISVWAGGDYFTKKGTLTFTEEETELKIFPIYGGIRFRLTQTRISPYLGLGVGYFQYKETNPIGEIEKGDVGYIVQAGCLFKTTGGFFFDIKGSYSYCKVKPADLEADLGGFKAGIGLGFEF